MSEKKMLKMENRKRKLEAERWLLATKKKCQNDVDASDISVITKDGENSSAQNVERKEERVKTSVEEEQIATLRKDVRKLKTQNLESPIFSLTECGSKARVTFTSTQESKTNPLFLKDIQEMLLFATLGNVALVKPRWCTFLRVLKVRNVVFLIIEGASIEHIRKYCSCFKWCKQIFERIVEVFSPVLYKSSLKSELLMYPIKNKPNKANAKSRPGLNPDATIETLFPICSQSDSNLQPGVGTTFNDTFPRNELLLTLFEMNCEFYPMPIPVGDANIKFTKDRYLPASASSPMFAIDCEMCLTLAHKSELTRVSIVNEDLECVYDTFVKPKNKIIDYRTQFSGITPQTLYGVKTFLEDVQQEIKRILPPNAILIGQSLGNDLAALNMMHPYVIDTSCIFNLTGLSRKKSKLKLLAEHLLGEDIQNKRSGHCSIEDSKAAMKLVQMKLKKGRAFGNVLLGGGVEDPNSKDDLKNETLNVVPGNTVAEFPCDSVFYHTNKWQKDVTILGVNSVIDECTTLLPTLKEMPTVTLKTESTNHEVSIGLRDICSNPDLSVGILDMRDVLEDNEKPKDVVEKGLKNLDKRIAKLYKALQKDDLLALVFSGSTKQLERNAIHNGLCMVALKD